MSSLQKRFACDAPHRHGSQMHIPAMQKTVQSGHLEIQQEMGDGIHQNTQPG